MKRKNIAMVAVLLLALMVVPFWGLFANPGNIAPGGSDDVVIYTFMLDGGHIDGNFDDLIITRRGGEFLNLPIPQRDGANFAGWSQVFSDVNNNFGYGNFTTKIYVAMWSFDYVPFVPFGQGNPFVPFGGTQNVTFILNNPSDPGGSPSDVTIGVIDGDPISSTDVPDVLWPVPFEWEFTGWTWVSGAALFAANFGDPVDPATIASVTDELIFAADWVHSPFNSAFPPYTPIPVISFNLDGGTFEPSGVPQALGNVWPEGPAVLGGMLTAAQQPNAADLVPPTFGPNQGTFMHWALTQGGTTPVDLDTTVFSASTTLYAVWTPTGGGLGGPFNVTFDLNGGLDAAPPLGGAVSPVAIPPIPAGETLTSEGHLGLIPVVTGATPAVFPPFVGYEFAHWASGSAIFGLGTQVDPATVPINGDATFYAIWVPIGSFTVIFDLADGEYTPTGDDYVAVTNVANNTFLSTILPNLADLEPPEHYTFPVGWALTPGGVPISDPATHQVTAGASTFYAIWTPYWQVTFHFNQGTHSNSAITDPHTIHVAPNGNVIDTISAGLTRTNHGFIGWASGSALAPGASPTPIDFDTTPITANSHFIAIWVAQHPVTFDFGHVLGTPIGLSDVVRHVNPNTSVPFADVPADPPAGTHQFLAFRGWHQVGVNVAGDPALSRLAVSGINITGATTFEGRWYDDSYAQVRFIAPAGTPISPGALSVQDGTNEVVLFVPSGTVITQGNLPTFSLPSGMTYRWAIVSSPGQGIVGFTAIGNVTVNLILYVEVVFELGTSVQYDSVAATTVTRLSPLAALGPVTSPAAPLLVHQAGATLNGWRRVDINGDDITSGGAAGAVSAGAPNGYYTAAQVNAMNITQAYWRFVAYWDFSNVQPFTATFLLAGGTYAAYGVGPVSRSGLLPNIEIPAGLVPTPVRSNFDFAHWLMDGTPVSPSALSPNYLSVNTTFTAVWTPIPVAGSFYVTFDFAGGTSGAFGAGPAILGPIANTNAIAQANVPVPTRADFIFQGWVVTGTVGPIVNPHQITSDNDLDISFTARWVPDNVMLLEALFNLAGGTCSLFNDGGIIISGPFAVNTPIIDIPVPTRAGFTFDGWVHEPNGTAITSAALATVNQTTDVEFTAVWIPNNIPGYYFATFYLDYGTYGEFGSGPVIIGPIAEGDPITNVPTPERFQREFLHWILADGTVVLAADFANISMNADMSFTAVWVPVAGAGQFIAMFEMAGGTSSNFGAGIGGTVTRGPFTINNQIPANEVPTGMTRPGGFTFEGWLMNGVLVSPSALATSPTGNVTFVADWQPTVVANNFRARFYLDGGTVPGHAGLDWIISRLIPHGQLVLVTDVPAPVRTGYTFQHWTLYNDATDTLVNPVGQTSNDADLYFRAVWEEIPQFNVTFNLAEGEYNGSTANVVRGPFVAGDQVPAAQVPVPTRNLFDLIGWLYSGDGTVVSPAAISSIVLQDATTFTAQWEAQYVPGHFVARFVFNGGSYLGITTFVERAGIPNGTQIPAASVPSPTRGIGWQYHWIIEGTPNDAIVDPANLDTPRTSNVTFVAIWTQVNVAGHFTATFDLAGGNVGGYTSNVIVPGIPNNTQINQADVPVPVRTNHNFLHWIMDGLGNTPVSPHALNVPRATDTLFTAVWQQVGVTPVQHTVTFDFDGGTSATHSPSAGPFTVQINNNALIGLANVPVVTRGNDQFVGWRQAGGAPGQTPFTNAYVANRNVTAPMTFIAVWDTDVTPTQHAVRFYFGDGTSTTHTPELGPVQIMVDHGTIIGLTNVPTLTRPGYDLLGWQQRGTVVNILQPANVANIVVTAPMTFDAEWDLIEDVPGHYRVTFRPGALAGVTLTPGAIGFVREGDVIFYIPEGTAIIAGSIPTLNLPQAQAFWLYEWDLTSGTLLPAALSSDGMVGFIPDGPVVFTAEYFIEITIGDNDPIRIPMGDVDDTTIGDILDGIDTTNPDDPDDEFEGWIRRCPDGNNITTAERGFYTRDELDAMGLDPSDYWNFSPVWRSGTFFATFHFAGGTLASHTGTYISSGAILHGRTIPAAYIPTLTNANTDLTFGGWVVTGTTAPLVAPASQTAQSPTASLSFTAVWRNGDDTPTYYTLTFNLNGGQMPGVELVQTHVSGTEISTLPTPTRANYNFTGWVIGATTEIRTVPFTITGNITLTAGWSRDGQTTYYTLTFNLNGGQMPGVNLVQTHASGTEISTLPTPTRTNYNFTGWTIGATTEIRTVPFTITGNITLTAGWSHDDQTTPTPTPTPTPPPPTYYTLTFNLNGGQMPNVELVQTHMMGTVINTLPTPTRANYNFTGWVIGATTEIRTVPFTITGNITLTAGWNRDDQTSPTPTPPPGQYTITLHLGTNATMPDGITQIVRARNTSITTDILRNPTRPGYRFIGWFDSSVNNWVTLPFVLVRNMDLTAIWETETPTLFTVTFNPGTGAIPHGVPATRTGAHGFRVALADFPTPIPPAGYTFIGWYLDGARIAGDLIVTRNMTLFAHYQRTQVGPRNYTITFVLNNGTMPTNTATTQTHPYGTHISALPTPTRAGHTFVGWMHGNVLQPVPFIIRGNMTLTASWTTTPQPSPSPQPSPVPPTHLVVVFDPGQGTFPGNETGIRTGVYGFVINTMPTPTRTGHTFAGWSIGTTPITLPLTVRQDTTVTARWTPIGTIVNPQTSPIQVTFTIFGAVLLVGIAAFGIMKLTGKQLAAQGQYRADMTRYNREKRLTDMFEKRGPKNKK